MFSLIWIGRNDDIYDPCFLQYELPFYYPGQVSYFAHSLSLEQSLSLSLSLSLFLLEIVLIGLIPIMHIWTCVSSLPSSYWKYYLLDAMCNFMVWKVIVGNFYADLFRESDYLAPLSRSIC